MRAVLQRVRDSGAAFTAVVRNPDLRRLEIGWAFSIVAHWAYLVAVSVYAYKAGGAAAVGLIFALRLVPAALLAPFTGLLADRYRRNVVMVGSALIRMILVAGAAVAVFLDGPSWIVYALAVAVGIATVPFRSAQAALLPSLARTPSELTAANAVVSTVESLAVFAGPVLAGLLLSVTSTGAVFTVTAVMLGIAAFFASTIRAPALERAAEVEAGTILSEVGAGFRAIFDQPPLRVLIGLLAAQVFVGGTLQVYIVVLAFQSLGEGDSAVGFLNAALGIGSLIGGFGAFSLTGASRLSRPFALGVLAWGVPLILLGAKPQLVLALLLLGIVGFGNSYMSVAGLTLEQRSVPDNVLARVFGVIQMIWWLALAAGALVAPRLVDWLGIRGALVASGAFLVVLVVLLWRPLAKIDAVAVAPKPGELRILTAVPIFTPLPGSSLEHLAGRLVPLRIEPDSVVVREGDEGDRFYIVAEGRLQVSEDGQPLAELEEGDYFGEIALLRDLPRTATVTARTPTVLYALDREDFLAAVSGHAPSAEAAERIVSARLGGVPAPGVPPSSA